MKYKIIITALTVVFTLPALADFVTISRAYELEPEHVNVPLSPSSSMLFSNCDECETTSGQLTAQTLFSVDGETVDFEDFCNALRLAKQSEHSGVFLQHHLESNAIESVSVSL
jgi:hypothetical protein